MTSFFLQNWDHPCGWLQPVTQLPPLQLFVHVLTQLKFVSPPTILEADWIRINPPDIASEESSSISSSWLEILFKELMINFFWMKSFYESQKGNSLLNWHTVKGKNENTSRLCKWLINCQRNIPFREILNFIYCHHFSQRTVIWTDPESR